MTTDQSWKIHISLHKNSCHFVLQTIALVTRVSKLFISTLLFSGPLSSFLIDRYSCRTAVIISGTLLALGFAGTAFAPNVYVAIVTYGLVAGKSYEQQREKSVFGVPAR